MRTAPVGVSASAGRHLYTRDLCSPGQNDCVVWTGNRSSEWLKAAYSVLCLEGESSRTRWVNEWPWPYANKTLFTQLSSNGIIFFLIEFIGMTLVNEIIQVSSVRFHNTPYAYCIAFTTRGYIPFRHPVVDVPLPLSTSPLPKTWTASRIRGSSSLRGQASLPCPGFRTLLRKRAHNGLLFSHIKE